jgi:hypothetical protein
VSISRRTLIGRIGLALPAAAFLATATGARAADEPGQTDASQPVPAPAKHKRHKKHASHSTRKHKVARHSTSATG